MNLIIDAKSINPYNNCNLRKIHLPPVFTYAHRHFWSNGNSIWPFTVWGLLKPNFNSHEYWPSEARCCNSAYRLRYWNRTIDSIVSPYWTVATVLTVYGIETVCLKVMMATIMVVATVLTVYGIETINNRCIHALQTERCNSAYRLRYWNPF